MDNPQKKKARLINTSTDEGTYLASQLNQTEDDFNKKIGTGIGAFFEILTALKSMIPENGDDGYTPVKGVDYVDGQDYVLTDQDKKDIASEINVPIVEKIIEKTTEIVHETPVVKEITKNIENQETPEETRDKLRSLRGDSRLGVGDLKDYIPVVLNNIVSDVILELKKGKNRLEARDILNLPQKFNMSDQRWHGGGLSTVIHDSTLTGDGTTSSPLHAVGGAGTPGGSDTDIQFNDGGTFGGDANFTWDKTLQQEVIIGTGSDIVAVSSTLRLEAPITGGNVILDFLFPGGNNVVGSLRSDGGNLIMSAYSTIFLGNDIINGSSWPIVEIVSNGFYIRTVNGSSNRAQLDTSLLSGDQLYKFPDASGTFMLTASGSGQFADNETPGGVFNDVNVTYTLANSPNPTGSLQLFSNGQFLNQGVEYTLSGSTITFATAPSSALSGLPFRAFYRF